MHWSDRIQQWFLSIKQAITWVIACDNEITLRQIKNLSLKNTTLPSDVESLYYGIIDGIISHITDIFTIRIEDFATYDDDYNDNDDDDYYYNNWRHAPRKTYSRRTFRVCGRRCFNRITICYNSNPVIYIYRLYDNRRYCVFSCEYHENMESFADLIGERLNNTVHEYRIREQQKRIARAKLDSERASQEIERKKMEKQHSVDCARVLLEEAKAKAAELKK